MAINDIKQRFPVVNAFCRRPAVTILALSLLLLSACGGMRTSAPGTGRPASQAEITRALSGMSYANSGNGENYYAADGALYSFQFLKALSQYQACKGTWRVIGSDLVVRDECRWREGGELKINRYKRTYEVRYSAYAWDLVGDNGTFEIYKSELKKGFGRAAEYNALRKRLGL